jgi:hypothetical protein
MKRWILLNAYSMLGQSDEDALLKPVPCPVARSLREEENDAVLAACYQRMGSQRSLHKEEEFGHQP